MCPKGYSNESVESIRLQHLTGTGPGSTGSPAVASRRCQRAGRGLGCSGLLQTAQRAREIRDPLEEEVADLVIGAGAVLQAHGSSLSSGTEVQRAEGVFILARLDPEVVDPQPALEPYVPDPPPSHGERMPAFPRVHGIVDDARRRQEEESGADRERGMQHREPEGRFAAALDTTHESDPALLRLEPQGGSGPVEDQAWFAR